MSDAVDDYSQGRESDRIMIINSYVHRSILEYNLVK